jgi:methylenetetrahydrofolate reductase (NADPH)
VLKDSGVREVGLPAYPEGHPLIPSDRLAQAFAEKLGLIAEQGLSPYVVTQFCFAPLRIIECCVDLALRAPQVLVYVGMAGPTSPLRLASYARRCGVSASLRALGAQGMGAVRLVTHTDPTEQLKVVAHHCRSRPQSNVVGVHLFSFGGAEPTARWMHRRMMLAEGAEP